MSSPSLPLPQPDTPGYLKLIKALVPHWRELGVTSLLINGCGLLMPLFSMLVYDKVIGNGNNETLWTLTIGMVLLMAIEFTLRVIRSYGLEQMGIIADLQVERALLDNICQSQVHLLSPVGALTSRYRDNAVARDHLFAQYVVAAADMPFLLLFIVILLVVGGPLALVTCLAGLLMLAGQLLLHNISRDLGIRSNAVAAQKTGLLAEVIFGIDIIKTSRWRHVMHVRWSKLIEASASLRGGSRFWQSLGQAWSMICITIASVFLLVAGIYRIEDGLLSVGALIACSLINLRAMGLMASIVGLTVSFGDLQRTQSELLKTTPSAPVTNTSHRMGEVRGEVQVQAVSWHYPGSSTTALHEISLHIKPGERVGLVGRPGSGKSTLLRCIAGLLQPSAGHVLIDGVSVLAVDAAELARWVAWKPQDAPIFSGTLQDNLEEGDEPLTARAAQVLESVGLIKAIRAGELRLDLPIHSGGVNLSGGQRQMLGLARGLSHDGAIYLLDEPTVGVDESTEIELAQAIARHTAGRTLIVSTHSRIMLGMVDRIVVLQNGKVVADGAREKILM